MTTKRKTTKTSKKKPTMFVVHRKPGHCMHCGSNNIEGSWGTAGYMQCNHCGKEWRGK